MPKWITISVLVGFMSLGSVTHAQDIATDAKSPVIHASSKKEKEALKKREKRQAEAAKAEKKLRKQHAKIQTKDVRKRMKKSRKEADRNNSHKKDSFLKKLFTKKK